MKWEYDVTTDSWVRVDDKRLPLSLIEAPLNAWQNQYGYKVQRSKLFTNPSARDRILDSLYMQVAKGVPSSQLAIFL
jgi:hypothetical protein